MPTLSIIAPVFEQMRMTEQFLNDIPLKIKSDYEVIIIDNGSAQETKDLLKKYPEVIVLTYPKNRYVTEPWNTGISIARGEYVMVCNNDITFSEGIDEVLINGYDGRIQSPLLVNVGDSRPLVYDHNINGTCWMIKKSDFTEEIPEDIKIWYNDNWLWNRYGNKWNYDCEVLHWGSQTVKSINHNPITSEDKLQFNRLCKERGWGKYYQTHIG